MKIFHTVDFTIDDLKKMGMKIPNGRMTKARVNGMNEIRIELVEDCNENNK